MGFEVQKLSRRKRRELSDRDVELVAQCTACMERIQGYCGGFVYESDHRYCDYDCANCRAKCCESLDGWQALASVGGSKFPKIDTPKSGMYGDYFGQTRVLFQVGGDIEKRELPFVIVNVEEIYNWTRDTWSKEKDIRKRFNIHENTKIGLSFYSRDDILDELAKGNIGGMCDEIERYCFDFYFSPNFSVYMNWPVLQNRVNMKRGTLYAYEFLARGWEVVHDVGWQTSTDKRRVCEFIQDNGIEVVSTTFQTLKATTNANVWTKQIPADIQTMLDAGAEKVVIFGATSEARMTDMVSWFGDAIIFVDTRLFRMSRYGKGFGETPTEKTACFQSSIDNIQEFYDNLRR